MPSPDELEEMQKEYLDRDYEKKLKDAFPELYHEGSGYFHHPGTDAKGHHSSECKKRGCFDKQPHPTKG